MPTPGGRAIMCAYKLCRVEFRYWGMQSKIERWGERGDGDGDPVMLTRFHTNQAIDNKYSFISMMFSMLAGLYTTWRCVTQCCGHIDRCDKRNSFHLSNNFPPCGQAWVWQDEWHGLTMDDIRDLERRTAEELKKKMCAEEEEEEAVEQAGEAVERLEPQQQQQDLAAMVEAGMRHSRLSSDRLSRQSDSLLESLVRPGTTGQIVATALY